MLGRAAISPPILRARRTKTRRFAAMGISSASVSMMSSEVWGTYFIIEQGRVTRLVSGKSRGL